MHWNEVHTKDDLKTKLGIDFNSVLLQEIDMLSETSFANFVAKLGHIHGEEQIDALAHLGKNCHTFAQAKYLIEICSNHDRYYDIISELWGHSHLRLQGYNNIQFILEKTHKTPDLSGFDLQGRLTVLEVKSIHRSDVDFEGAVVNGVQIAHGQLLPLQNIAKMVPNGLKKKIEEALRVACRQIEEYRAKYSFDSAIILLVMELDFTIMPNRKLVEDIMRVCKRHLRGADSPGYSIEILFPQLDVTEIVMA
jgi:hypothetical protein